MRIIFAMLIINTLLLINTGNGIAYDWNKAPGCVLQAASQGLAGYLEKIPLEEAADYGFSSANVLTEIMNSPVFGSPLLLRTITPNALDSYTKEMTAADLISDMELWYVPLLEKQRVIAFLIVEQSEKFNCQAVSFGYARVAANYEEILSRLGSQKRDKAVLVVVQQAQEYFIAFPEDEPNSFYSLRTQGTQNTQRAGEPESSLSSVVKRLNPVVKANIQESEGWK